MRTILCFFFFLSIHILVVDAHIGPPIDKDGGHVNEKTGKYHYHFPSRRGVDMNPDKFKKPKATDMQEIFGVVSKITDTKSVWIRIPSRQSYMILSQVLSKSNRNDKNKEVRVILKFVSPMASVISAKFDHDFRKKWNSYVIKILERELLTSQVKASFSFLPKSGQFRGMVFKKVSSNKGVKAKNINLWMVYEGLSYYLIEHGRAYQDKEFIKAQEIAKRKKAGLWGY